MARSFLKWLNGYLKVRLKGYSPERFLNLCRTKNIYVWNITCEDQEYGFCIGIAEYRQLKPVVRKTKTWPVIKKRYGFPFFFAHWKKRMGFLTGLLFFFCLLILMSKLIWSIEISGQYTHTKEELLKYLGENGVHKLLLIKDVNCTKLEEAIRKEYEDIGWVSAQIDGTKLLIRIKETNMPVLYQKQSIPAHLVASRDGVVSSIMTRSGTPLVKAGDEVKKDDVLISGVLDIIGDNGALLRKEPVVADGDVILNTNYVYRDEKSLKYTGKEYTGKSVKGISLRFSNSRLEFGVPGLFIKGWKNTARFVETRQFLFFTLEIITQKEYVEKEMEYSIKEATGYLNQRFLRYVEKISEKGVIIQQNNVKIKKSGGKLLASGTLNVLEPVAAYRKILDSEWRNTQDYEHSGNDH